MRISDWSSDVGSSDLNRGNPTDRTHKDGYRHWAMPRWSSHRGVAPLSHHRNENAPVWRNARTKSGRGKPTALLSAHNHGVQAAHRFAQGDRRSVVVGTSVSVRVALDCRRSIKKYNNKQ